MVLGWIATGLENVTVCQPVAVSLVNVAGASSVPVAVHRLPMWVPVLVGGLVEADAADLCRRVGL